MATGPNFAPPLPLMQPPACRLLDPPNSPPIDPFLADRLRNHRHLAIAPMVKCLSSNSVQILTSEIKTLGQIQSSAGSDGDLPGLDLCLDREAAIPVSTTGRVEAVASH